jgi:hypothetical protein
VPELKWPHLLAVVCVLALVWTGSAVPLAAQTPAPILSPHIAPHLPLPPLDAPLRQVQPPASSPYAQSLPPLRAVLLVGPIGNVDGSDSSTQWQIQAMDLAAAELSANGVAVSKFYAPNCDWNQIKAAVNGANFVFYRGHGVYWSALPSPIVGGFYLSSRDSKGVAQPKWIDSDAIRNDLKPAPNSVVMLGSACFSAGTADDTIDPVAISSTEAQRRVAMYSDAFLDIGAAGYYANWRNDGLQMFVRYLFQGQTLGQAYHSFSDYNPSTGEAYVHPQHPSNVMWLDKDVVSGKAQYDNAFVGQPNKTLAGLFAPAMAVNPKLSTYIARPADPARTYAVNVDCTPTAVLTWTATLVDGGPWLTLNSPTTGLSGDRFTLAANPAGQSIGVHRGHIRVTTDTPGIQSTDQTVTVTLSVLTNPWRTYAPIVNH